MVFFTSSFRDDRFRSSLWMAEVIKSVPPRSIISTKISKMVLGIHRMCGLGGCRSNLFTSNSSTDDNLGKDTCSLPNVSCQTRMERRLQLSGAGCRLGWQANQGVTDAR